MQDFNDLGDAGVSALVNARISVEASRIWIDLLYSRHFCNGQQRVSFERGTSSHFVVRHCPNGDVLREPIDSAKMDSIIRQAEQDWSVLKIRHDVGGSAFVNACSVEDSAVASLENELLDSIISQAEHDVGGSAFVIAFSVEDSEEASIENQFQMRQQQLELTFHRLFRDFCEKTRIGNSLMESLLSLFDVAKVQQLHREFYRQLRHDFYQLDTDTTLWDNLFETYIECKELLSKEPSKEYHEWFSANSDFLGQSFEKQPFPCRVAFSFRRLHLVRYFHFGGHCHFIVSSCIISSLFLPTLSRGAMASEMLALQR
jgi:hypothetical protein